MLLRAWRGAGDPWQVSGVPATLGYTGRSAVADQPDPLAGVLRVDEHEALDACGLDGRDDRPARAD